MPPQAPARIPLASSIEWRDSNVRGATRSVDAQLINCIAEFVPAKKIFVIKKRPGFGTAIPFGSPTLNGIAQGMFAVSNSLPFLVTANVVYVSTFQFALSGFSQVQLTSTPGNTAGYFIKNTTNAYVLSFVSPPTNFIFTPVTSNYPAVTVPGFAFLDGTMYVMDVLGQIWGSALNDTSTWNTTNRIVAQNEPDFGVAITKHLVYVLAFKQWTTEVFYDAGNPTGSPLSPVPEALITYGCANPNTIQDMDGTKFWLANDKQMQPQVVRLDGLTPTVVSTPPVERVLSQFIPTPGPFAGALETTYSFVLKVGGHRFYGLTNTFNNLTVVLDIDQQMWYRWTDAFGNYWPFAFGGWNTQNNISTPVMQNIKTGALIAVDADYVYPTDNGVSYSADIYTDRMDMQVDRNKTLSALHVNADIGDMNALVRYSDDDYQIWSQPRYIDLNNTRPYMDNLGSFYNRAFHFRIKSESPMRLSSMDLQLDIGPI